MIVSGLIGKQRASFQLATARLNIWEGSVRSSKTICSLLRWLKFVREAPPGPLLMVGKTERTLKRNVLDVLVQMLGKRRCRINLGQGEMRLLGRLVYLAGANNELAADKIAGMTLVGTYVDEISRLPQSFFAMLLTRLSVAGAKLFGTSNPDGPAHWLKVNYLDRAALWLDRDGKVHENVTDTLDLHRFSFQLADNPNLTAEFVANIAAENVGLFYRRNILGEWCIAEGSIYEAWDPDRHVLRGPLPPIGRWIALAVDYGTTNPFHAGLLGLDATNRRLVLGHEWRWDSKRKHRSLTDAEYSGAVRGWCDTLDIRPEWTVIDPSAASFRVQMFRDGWTSIGADNDVVDGIRDVASLFATGQLVVHESCPELIAEIPGYAWDPKASEKGKDEPIKVNDHGCDMLRYGVHSTEQLWRPQLALAA